VAPVKKIVQDKLFLYDVKDTVRSDRDVIRKVLEDTMKEMGYESNGNLIL
jgi:hypothetical protein